MTTPRNTAKGDPTDNLLVAMSPAGIYRALRKARGIP